MDVCREEAVSGGDVEGESYKVLYLGTGKTSRGNGECEEMGLGVASLSPSWCN